jgi:hypothetical protein
MSPITPETGPLAQLPKCPPEIGEGHRRAVAAAEDEALLVVPTKHPHLLPVAVKGGDEERVSPIERRLRGVFGSTWPA